MKNKNVSLFVTLFSLFILFSLLLGKTQVAAEEMSITPDNFSSNFQLNGDATYDSNSKIVTLTKDENYKSGAVVLKSIRMDLNYAFNFDADINIGTKSQALGGADGIGVVLHPGSLGDLGGNGGSFGMMSMKNAFGFKIDTFFNSQYEPLYVNAYDPAWLANSKGQLDYPFGAFMYTQDSGLQVYTLGAGNNYEKPQYVSNPNGTFRNIKMSYNPSNKYLTVNYDGKTWIKDVSQWKGNNRYFVLGIAGTTGGEKNLQQVKINRITYTGETNLDLNKSNDKSTNGAKVGDTVSYTVTAKNSGNLVLEVPFIEDTLPEGMAKPTNVRVNTSSDLGEGTSNKNSFGEYYTWDQNNRKLKVYFSQTNGLEINTTGKIYYKSKVLSGNDGDTKTNKVSLAGINDGGIHPEAQSSFKIKGDPKIGLSKTASPTTAKVGDKVNYTIYAKNTGNATLINPCVVDKIPDGVDKPSNIRINIEGQTYSNISEGKNNANSQGQYYTWDQGSREIRIYLSSKVNLKPGITGTIYYDATVSSGSDGDKKINTAQLFGTNDGGNNPKSSATVTIKGDPKLEVSKTATPTTAKIGDFVNYTIIGKNTGNATLNDVVFTDVLPEGMSEPTDVTILGAVGDAYKLPKGASNVNQFGEYYEWNASSRTMTVIVSRKGQSTGIIANGTGNESQRKITYTSKVLNGKDGDQKTNTVMFSGSNGPTKPTAKATVTIKDKKIKLHIKQEVINKNSQVVVPSRGGGNLKQVNVDAVSDVQGSYGLIFPSYEADTNKAFETISLKWSDDYQWYILDNLVPEFYDYEGYVLTTSEEKHDSNKRIKDSPPVMDYSLNNEYWLTIYITPKVSEDGPPFYNWDYKVNDFGKIKF